MRRTWKNKKQGWYSPLKKYEVWFVNSMDGTTNGFASTAAHSAREAERKVWAECESSENDNFLALYYPEAQEVGRFHWEK